MSVKPTYHCDICGAERKEANHWFLVEEIPNGCLMLIPWDIPQSEGFRDQTQFKHVCGETCAHSIVDAWMSKSGTR